MDKKVAIIILNYNDSENTIRYVNEISKYDILNKIVIVDNHSNKENEYEKLLKLASDKVDVIRSDKNGGYSYGNNYGLKYLESKNLQLDYVIISNSDISVEENAIKECIEFLKSNKNAAIVAPRMYYVDGPARRSAWKKRTPIVDIANSTRLTEFILFPIFKLAEYGKKDFENKITKVDNISGAFFVADYKKIKEIDFFDENVFLFYEEDILGYKFSKLGYEIYSINDIKFIHYDSRTIGKIMNMFKKQDILFDSRKYFQKVYNKANFLEIFILNILRYIRKFELIFEVPIRKITSKK